LNKSTDAQAAVVQKTDAQKTAVHELEARIGHVFGDADLLQQALTHASANAPHMERLEFLGDAVLGVVIAEALYCQFPDVEEGALTRMRAALVCRDGLLVVARAWAVDGLLTVGCGERDSRNKVRAASIIANAVEAIIGAVFLDGGWQKARETVLGAWGERLENVKDEDGRDAKTRLQEYTQAQGWGLPEYIVTDYGAERHPRFTARCLVRGDVMGEGLGERKKNAELEAAQQVCQTLIP